jgi:membrane-associated protease RseP (regulator of RpoE activity)
MFNLSENFAVLGIILVALTILIWSFNRSKNYGKLGIIAWLQSVTLMVPWLAFFGLFSAGIYLNFLGIIFLLVTSAIGYIYLGNILRKEGEEELKKRAAKIIQEQKTISLNKEENKEDELLSTERRIEGEILNPNEGNEPIKPEIIPIKDEDLQTIKSIFGIDTFFATETIAYQEGAIFKGNLRGEPDIVHEELSNKLKEKLGEKYRLFLVETPDSKPVIIILPSSNDPKPSTLAQKNLALVLFLATIFTSLEAMSILLGFDLVNNWNRYQEVIPLALGLWTILIAHEMGHQVIAKKHNIRVSLPFFLPTWQIGSFGAITRFESLLPNRTALFDVSFAGPACGGIVSLIMLFIGLILSQSGSTFQVPTVFFQGSVLVGTLAKVILGSTLESSVIDVHPLVVIGWLGLVITALNLLPAGQLDGGRIVQAIYGRKIARRTTIASLIVLGIVALINPANSIPLYWGIVILFLQRDLERPSLNELTEPDDTRAGWGLLILFLMLATLIPLSPSLAGRLGIGI